MATTATATEPPSPAGDGGGEKIDRGPRPPPAAVDAGGGDRSGDRSGDEGGREEEEEVAASSPPPPRPPSPSPLPPAPAAPLPESAPPEDEDDEGDDDDDDDDDEEGTNAGESLPDPAPRTPPPPEEAGGMEGGRNSSEGSAVAGRRASEDEAESESESETEVAEEDWKIGGDDGGSAKGGGEDRAGRRRPRDARSPAPSSSSSSQSSSPPPSVDAADLSLDERAVGRCDDDVEEDDDDSEDPASVASDHPSDYYRDDDDDGGSSGDETSSASSVRSADRSPLSSSGEGSAEEEGGDDGPLRPSSPDAAGSPAPVDGFERDSPSPDEDDAAAAFDDDDDSLGFPPGYSTRRSELSSLQNHDDGPLRRGSSDLFLLPAHRRRGSSLRSSLSSASSSVNPSVIPSYFFCPLSHSIMKDPVLTPYGNTYDRRSILRWLILAKTDPLSKGALDAGDLKDDRLVRRAIERARREAWVRYVVELEEREGVSIEAEGEGNGTPRGSGLYEDEEDMSFDDEGDLQEPAPPQASQSASMDESIEIHDLDSPHSRSPGDEDEPPSSPPHAPATVDSPSAAPAAAEAALAPAAPRPGHGWNVPLGVHRISCAPPGLPVTIDVHRRSGVVKRKVVRKSLAEDGSRGKGKKKVKLKRKKSRGSQAADLKTVTSVVSRDLTLPPGSHVEVLETRVHGGRVRGRIVWEEEVTTEVDRELALLLEEEEVRRRAMAKPKKGSVERSDLSGGGGTAPMPPVSPRVPRKPKVKNPFRRRTTQESLDGPFASDLFDGRAPHHSPAPGPRSSRSPSPPLTTIKYAGWISLQWAGGDGSGGDGVNYERDEALRKRRETGGGHASDEDEGPWTSALPLGVYGIGDDRGGGGSESGPGSAVTPSAAGQVPLYDSPDDDTNVIDYLVPGRCLEVVETRVMVMKRPERERRRLSMSSSLSSSLHGVALSDDAPRGRRVVLARCSVPALVPPPPSADMISANGTTPTLQRRFRSGWIVLGEDQVGGAGTGAAASPVPVGAYLVTTGSMSCNADARIRMVYPPGSCMEVDATRIEFDEEDTSLKCEACGHEGTYHTIAVRALVSTGGYVTLFTASVGGPASPGSPSRSGLCACGRPVRRTYALPVPLGLYRIVSPTFLTRGAGRGSPAIARLGDRARVRVVETRVEEGRVRGRIDAVAVAENEEDGASLTPAAGWISLFEPPSSRWAEPVATQRG